MCVYLCVYVHICLCVQPCICAYLYGCLSAAIMNMATVHKYEYFAVMLRVYYLGPIPTILKSQSQFLFLAPYIWPSPISPKADYSKISSIIELSCRVYGLTRTWSQTWLLHSLGDWSTNLAKIWKGKESLCTQAYSRPYVNSLKQF